MAEFSSFKQFKEFFNDKYSPKKIQKKVLAELRDYLEWAVKDMHGKKLPGWKSGSNPTPLLKTGKLRDGVTSKKSKKDEVTIYTKEEYLALIHEYGKTWKMTDKQRKFLFAVVIPNSKGPSKKSSKPGYITIPARPLWSKALQVNKKEIKTIVDDILLNLEY